MDPSGMALKFNEFLDLIQIFKYFGFWFGTLLDQFIDNLSGYQPEEQQEAQNSASGHSSAKRLLNIIFGRKEMDGARRLLYSGSGAQVKESAYHRYKFEKYKVGLGLGGVFLVKTALYLAFWALKLLRLCLFRQLKRDCSDLKKWTIKAVVYLRQAHFIVFGACLMDLSFYNSRIILHRKNDFEGVLAKAVASATSTLLIVDLIEIVDTAVSMKFKRVRIANSAKNCSFHTTFSQFL